MWKIPQIWHHTLYRLDYETYYYVKTIRTLELLSPQ